MPTDNRRPEPFVYREAAEQRWKIGQVAELFDLSVQTLRYYDSIGLFSPHFRDEETGYRYYLQTQIYRLANIIYLRKQGYSIREIKAHLDNLTFRGRSAGLQSQAAALEREVKRLHCISKAINAKLSYIEQSDYETRGQSIHTCRVDERHYIEIGPEQELYASDVFYYFPTMVIYRPDAKVFGACIQDKADLFSYASLVADVDTLERKVKLNPAGRVLRSHYVGPYETIGTRLIEMMDYAEAHALDVCEYSIHYNIIDQFVERDPANYVTEIQIPFRSKAARR